MATREEGRSALDRLERVFEQFEKNKGNQNARRELLQISNLSPETFEAAYLAWKDGRSIEDYGVADAILQGVTFGFGDEIKAWFQTMGEDDDAYTQRLGEIRAAKQVFETENPMIALASEMAGGVATLATPMGLPLKVAGAVGKAVLPALRPAAQAAQAPTFAGQAMRSGVAGATEGYVGGVGRGEGEFAERSRGAVMDTLLGGAGGAGIPALTGVGSTLYRNIGRSPEDLVAQQIASTMGTRGIPEVKRRVTQRAVEGEVRPEMIADIAGEAAQRKVRGARVAVPEFGQELAETLAERQMGARGRVLSDVEEAIGVRFDETLDPEQIASAQAARAKVDYDALRAEYKSVPIKDLEGLMRAPAVRDNFQETIDEMMNRQAMGELSLEDIRNMPRNYDAFMELFKSNRVEAPFAFLETLTRKIGDDISAAKRAGKGSRASSLVDFKDRLTGAIDAKATGNIEKGVPSYADARRKFADSSVVLDAFEKGQKFTSMTPAQVQRFMADATESQKEAFLQASYQNLSDTFRREGTNVADRVARDVRLKGQIAALAGGEGSDAYRKLLDSLKREQEMFRSSGVMAGGSVTADKLVDVEDFENLSQFARNVEQFGMIGGPARSAYEAALQPLRATDINLRAARAMTETDPLRQLQTMSRVQEALPSQRMREGLITGSGRAGRAVGMGAGIQQRQPEVILYTTPQARALGLLD